MYGRRGTSIRAAFGGVGGVGNCIDCADDPDEMRCRPAV